MIKSKGFRTYKQYWEDQAGFMDKPPWNNEKVLKIIISNKHEKDIEKLELSNHSITKENGSFTIKIKIPHNYLELDNFESKAMELLGIKKDWLTAISLDRSYCSYR